MRIRNLQLMLCLAASMLVISSCQKEEELLSEAPPDVSYGMMKNNPDDDGLCGALPYVHDDATGTVGILQKNLEDKVQEFIAGNPDVASGTSRNMITIPVVFHVVYTTSEQNISDAQIQSQVDVLNEDFNAANADIGNVPSAFQPFIGNANLHFELAARDPAGNTTTGITRTYTTVSSFSSNGSVCFSSQGGHDAWPTSQYLNIWVCNKSGAAGFATYPWSGNSATDGIIVKYTYVGRVGTFTNNWNYQKGRTITHEAGHWLGLIHIWGDAACGNDLVGDTPLQTSANGSCPSFPDISSCSPNSNGDMYMNYMDYTYDACRNMFSALQVTRMLGFLNTTRAGILTSLGAVPPAGACNAPGTLSASSVTSNSASLSWVSTGAVSYNVKYKPAASSTWTTLATSSTTLLVSGLSSSTAYEFQVQSVCASGTSAYSSSATFTTSGATSGCSIPAGLYVSNITSNGATLNWNSTGAVSYIVRYRKSSSSSWMTVSSATPYRNIAWLSPNTSYEFQVRSVCITGFSPYSSLKTFTTGY